jgi:hypothetical protein
MLLTAIGGVGEALQGAYLEVEHERGAGQVRARAAALSRDIAVIVFAYGGRGRDCLS